MTHKPFTFLEAHPHFDIYIPAGHFANYRSLKGCINVKSCNELNSIQSSTLSTQSTLYNLYEFTK